MEARQKKTSCYLNLTENLSTNNVTGPVRIATLNWMSLYNQKASDKTGKFITGAF